VIQGFIYNPEDPLARCAGESRRANQALRDYVDMGAGRSLTKLYSLYRDRIATGYQPKPPSSRLPTLKTWSTNYGWQARLTAIEKIQNEADRQLWADRRKQIIQRDYEQADELRALADMILAAAPSYVLSSRRFIPAKKDKDGSFIEPEREIITEALDGRLLVQALRAASDLQRRASGLDERLFLMNIDMTRLTDDQLLAIANGADILSVLSSSPQTDTGADQDDPDAAG
jgi:hypothetical protein